MKAPAGIFASEPLLPPLTGRIANRINNFARPAVGRQRFASLRRPGEKIASTVLKCRLSIAPAPMLY
jgi:hypothetical protein